MSGYDNSRPALQPPVAQGTSATQLGEGPNLTRIKIANWQNVGIVSAASLTPTRPVVMVCLGPDDTSGGCIITTPDANPASSFAIGVSAPWEGRLTAPMQIGPLVAQPVAQQLCTLDLLFYYAYPPWAPKRAPLYKVGPIGNGGGSLTAPTLGRRRVRVAMGAPSASADVAIYGYFYAVGTGGAVQTRQYAGGLTVTAPMMFEFDARNPPADAHDGESGVSAPDAVAIIASGASAIASIWASDD